MRIQLITNTENPEAVVAAAARLCYSNKKIDEIVETMMEKDPSGFIQGLVDMGHESPLEHASFTFGIEGISRACANQIVRHRIGSYCLSGDTEVYTDFSNRGVRKRTIKELYNMKKQYRDMTHIRGVDEDNLILINNDILDVLATGKKEVYKVATKNGYEIKSTLEHKFYTEEGWKRLKDIEIKDKVYVNGEPLYQNKEWLKDKYYKENLSQEEIGRLCNVSKHTIRKWVREHSLQKDLGEWSKNVEPPNKGRTKNDYEPMRIVSEKLKGNSNYSKKLGTEHHSYKEDITESGRYGRVLRNYERKYTCNLCGKETENIEVHHIDLDPTNDKWSNLEELCVTCHKVRHKGSVVRTIILDEIENIEYYGEEETYDISMKAPHHNFIANGFVVHNSQKSQRYVEEDDFEYVVPDKLTNPKAQELFIEHMEFTNKIYNDVTEILEGNGLDKKQSIEDARYVLPNACTTSIVVSMNARSLLNFFSLRCCNRAQKEIRDVAYGMLREVKKVAPNLFKNAGKPCTSMGYCPEGSMQCEELKNVYPTLEELLSVYKNYKGGDISGSIL